MLPSLVDELHSYIIPFPRPRDASYIVDVTSFRGTLLT